MLTVGHGALVVRLWPLLFGEVIVDRIVLEDSEVLIETNPEGRLNWHLADEAGTPDPPPTTATDGAGRLPRIRQVLVRNARVLYRPDGAEEPRRFAVERLSLTDGAGGGRVVFDAAARIGEIPIEASGELGPLADLVRGDTPYPLSVRLTGRGMALTAKGTLDAPRVPVGLDLAVDLEGSPPPPLAAFTPLQLSGRIVEAQDGSWTVENLQAAMGPSDVSGTVRITPGSPAANLQASLVSRLVDLGGRGAGSGPGKGGSGGDGRVVPDLPLPFAPAIPLAGEVRLDAERLILPGGGEGEGVAATVRLQDGRLTAEAGFGRLAGGEMSLSLATGPPADGRVEFHCRARGVVLSRLFAGIGVETAMEGGRLTVDIAVSGTGTNLRPALASLDGSLLFALEDLELRKGLLNWVHADLFTNLIDAISPFEKDKVPDRILCLVARAPVRGGLAAFEPGIGLQSDRLNVVAGGTVHLGTEALDMKVALNPREGLRLSVGQVASRAARIRGTIARPAVTVDVLGAAKTAAGMGLALTTAGLSVIAPRALDMAFGKDDPCGAVRDDAATPEKAEDNKGVLQRIGSGLKRLGDKAK
jgi:hypothetical protein